MKLHAKRRKLRKKVISFQKKRIRCHKALIFLNRIPKSQQHMMRNL